MELKRIVRGLIIIAILSTNISCDQISKSIVREHIEYNQQITLINNFITLTKVENTGAFLSAGASLSLPVKAFLLMILPMVVLCLAFIFLIVKKNLSFQTMLGICFIIGGGIGNIYDRIIYGSVTDFVHIDFVIFQTGIFNMADVSIMTGTLLVLAEPFLRPSKKVSEIS